MSTSVSDHKPQTWANELTKSCYQTDQQLKFRDLQAEVDSLLQQLQNLKQQRSATNTIE